MVRVKGLQEVAEVAEQERGAASEAPRQDFN